MTEAELRARIVIAKETLRSKKEMLPQAHQFRLPHSVTRKCPVTGEQFTIIVEAEDWISWRSLANTLFPLSHYFPYLTDGERDSLISGISPEAAERFKDSDADPECED